jgi:protein SCO1/2
MKAYIKLSIIIVILLVAGGFLAGPLLIKKSAGDFSADALTTILVYPKKNPLPEFSLLSTHQQVLSPKNMQGKWHVIFTGYTHCPDICPTTLDDMNKIYQQLPEKIKQQVRFTFVSVDADRDSIERIKEYIEFFNDNFVGATGDSDNLDRFVYSLGAVYRLNKKEGEFYSVDHSARLFIVDPKVRRFGLINHEVLQNKAFSQVADELTKIITHFSS